MKNMMAVKVKENLQAATYLQMNATHTTHWSVQYSVYIAN